MAPLRYFFELPNSPSLNSIVIRIKKVSRDILTIFILTILTFIFFKEDNNCLLTLKKKSYLLWMVVTSTGFFQNKIGNTAAGMRVTDTQLQRAQKAFNMMQISTAYLKRRGTVKLGSPTNFGYIISSLPP